MKEGAHGAGGMQVLSGVDLDTLQFADVHGAHHRSFDGGRITGRCPITGEKEVVNFVRAFGRSASSPGEGINVERFSLITSERTIFASRARGNTRRKSSIAISTSCFLFNLINSSAALMTSERY